MVKRVFIGIIILWLIVSLPEIILGVRLFSEGMREIIAEYEVMRRDEAMTEEIMVEIWENNKDVFQSVAEDMFGIGCRWRLSKLNPVEDKSDANDGLPFDYTEDNIRISINDRTKAQEVSSLKSIVEKNNNFYKILYEFSFEGIDSSFFDAECIDFYDSDSFNSAGLIYCPEGEPDNLSFKKVKKLDDCWYYYLMEN